MIIATRILSIQTASARRAIPVRIFAPEQEDTAWICRYEIDWPDSMRRSFAAGLDAVQALHLTLQKIGVDLYMSQYHASGTLVWIDPDDGYGFPVPKNGRDILVGTDKTFDG